MFLYRLVGLLYLVSGIWCLFKPELAAAYVGYRWSNQAALAEFVAVYGGLQIGIASAVLSTSLKSNFIRVGVLYTLILSASLVLARIVGFWRYGVQPEIVAMLVVEIAIVFMLITSSRLIEKTVNKN